MTQTLPGTQPDIDLTNGNLPDRGAHEVSLDAPTSRCSATATAHAADPSGGHRGLRDLETFSNTGGIRPDNPGMPYMTTWTIPHLLRRKLTTPAHPETGMDKMSSIDTYAIRGSTRCANERV